MGRHRLILKGLGSTETAITQSLAGRTQENCRLAKARIGSLGSTEGKLSYTSLLPGLTSLSLE